jgi:nitrite reductase/ring-hydroxylating ferredoxin subunit
MTDSYERLNRQIDDMLADHAPKPFVAEDDEEREVIEMSARLRMLRPGVALPRRRYVRAIYGTLSRVLNPKPRFSRRGVVFGSAGGLVAGIAAGLGISMSTRGQRAAWRLPWNPPEPDLSGWLAVARLQDVPQGGTLAFTSKAFSGYVMRTGDQLTALSAICNHMQCRVDVKPDGTGFVCSCDGAMFDHTGKFVSPNYATSGGPKPLSALEVRVNDDMVYVKPA